MHIQAKPHSRLQCEMSIRKYRASEVHSKVKPVRVEAAGPDGLRFTTELRMPPDPGLLLAFSVSFEGKSAKPQGTIIAVLPRPDGRFAYDVRFDFKEGRSEGIGWLELLLGLSAYQHLRYADIGEAYKGIEPNVGVRAGFDVRA